MTYRTRSPIFEDRPTRRRRRQGAGGMDAERSWTQLLRAVGAFMVALLLISALAALAGGMLGSQIANSQHIAGK